MDAFQRLRWSWSDTRTVDAEVGQHREVTVELWNDEPTLMQLDAVSIAGSSTFTVQQPAPASIAPNAAAGFVVRFEPTTAGLVQGTLVVLTAGGSGTTLALSGRATARTTPSKPRTDPAQSARPRDDQPPVARAASPWKLAAPPQIDLGDHVIGAVATHHTSIFALDRDQGPRVHARVTGDPSIRLVHAPLFLPAAGGTYDETQAFKLQHKPSRKGEVRSILEVVIVDAPQETFRYPVIAAAHLAGDPTLAEEQATDRETARQEQADADAAAKRQRVEQEIAEEYERDTHYHAGHKLELWDEARLAELALQGLFNMRLAGIAAADTEIGNFVRQKHIAKPSLLEQLAWMALDVATAGIAGGLAKQLDLALTAVYQQPIGRTGKTSEVTPSKAIAAIFTDGLKETIKKSAKLRSAGSGVTSRVGVKGPDVGTTADGDTFANESSDPKAAFFMRLRDGLAGDTFIRANELVTTARNALLPLLKVDHRKAIAAMTAIKMELVSQHEEASRIHAEQSVRKWVRYVAETSGSTDAHRAFDDKQALTPIDGLIDLTIKPDYREAAAPVEITGARVHGVRAEVVERLALQPLIKLGLPVRAAGDFNSPVATLNVVRHGDGSVSYTENTGVEGSNANGWLKRKAAVNGRGPDAEWGARILLEKEIMTKRLMDLVSGIDNDSQE